jgi:hypothetical protein
VVAVAAGAAGGFCCLLLTIVIGVVICRKADRDADELGFASAAPIDKRVPVELHQLRAEAADVPYTEMAIPPGDYDHGRFDAPVDKRVPVELHQLSAHAPYTEMVIPPGDYDHGRFEPDAPDDASRA